MGRTLVFAALIVAASVTLAAAVVPHNMHYQGVLTDGAGTPVTDGTYNITFNLYQQPTGGTPEWTQTSPVMVAGGIFNVTLSGLPIELFEHPTYLGIAIDGGAEMTPRRELASSPYALNAATVQDSAIHHFKIAAGTVVRSLNSLTEHINLSAGTNVTITPSGNDLTISASGGGGVGGSGASGQIAIWTAAGTTLEGTNDLFWDSALGRLGIGTPNPNAPLRVEGSSGYTAVIAGDNLDDNTQVLRVNFVGTGSGANPVAIYGQSKPEDGYGIGGDFMGGRIGLHAFANIGNQVTDSYGIHAEATGTGGNNRYGVLAEVAGPGGIRCYAVRGNADAANATYSAGTYGHASVGQYRYGAFGEATPGGTGYFGVAGDATISASSAAVYALGDLQYTGSLIGPPSDERLKAEVQPYAGALASVTRLQPKTFRYKTDDPRYDGIHMAPGRHYGLLAQDLEAVLPELVVERVHPRSPRATDDPGPPLMVKGIKYMELIPVLVQAIKEQQETIEDLQARLAKLEGE